MAKPPSPAVLGFFYTVLESEAMRTKITSDQKEKEEGRMRGWWNLSLIEHDLQVTLRLSCHPHTLWTLLGHSRRHWKVEEMLEAIWEGGTPTPLMVERSQLKFDRLGVLENKRAWWHDALWPHSAGCEQRDRKWKITAAHTMAMVGTLRRPEPSDFHPDWLFPLHGGNFIPLKITMNFGLRRNGIIYHLNVWCVMGKIWKEVEILLTILSMNNLRFSTASDQINDVTILFIIQPIVNKHLAFMIFHREVL